AAGSRTIVSDRKLVHSSHPVMDHHQGHEAQHEAGDKGTHSREAFAVSLSMGEQLFDDIDDGAPGQRKEKHAYDVRDPEAAHHCADERRPSAYEAEKGKVAPARLVAAKGRGDAEAFGHVVQ